jgi:4-amino-4-deoxy-L-arabinose transferase-like glycosyltransferase
VILLFVVLPRFSNDLSSRYGVGFADDYDKLANSLLQGYGYRFGPDLAETMMREPGYPVFLAGVFSVFGNSLDAARLANILLVVGIVLMIVRMARLVSTDPVVPLVASLLFLLYPSILVAEARAGVEMFFIFLLMIFMLTLQKAMNAGRGRHYFFAGLALGAVLLTRGTLILFPILLLLYLFVIARTWQERWHRVAKVGALVIAAALVISPWVIRNYKLVHEFVPTATVQGAATQAGQYIGKHLSFEKGFMELDSEAGVERNALASKLGYTFQGGYYQYFFRSRDEFDFNSLLLRTAMDEYRQDPVLFVRCASMNLFNFWFAGKSWQVTWLNMVLQLPFVIIALAGAYLLWKRSQLKQAAFILLFILYLYAVHVPVHAQARYSVPLVPFLAILASIAIVHFWRIWQRKADDTISIDQKNIYDV